MCDNKNGYVRGSWCTKPFSTPAMLLFSPCANFFEKGCIIPAVQMAIKLTSRPKVKQLKGSGEEFEPVCSAGHAHLLLQTTISLISPPVPPSYLGPPGT